MNVRWIVRTISSRIRGCINYLYTSKVFFVYGDFGTGKSRGPRTFAVDCMTEPEIEICSTDKPVISSGPCLEHRLTGSSRDVIRARLSTALRQRLLISTGL